jgi:hypothetical protein
VPPKCRDILELHGVITQRYSPHILHSHRREKDSAQGNTGQSAGVSQSHVDPTYRK